LWARKGSFFEFIICDYLYYLGMESFTRFNHSSKYDIWNTYILSIFLYS